MNFGDLEDDHKIKEKLTNFHDGIEKIDEILQVALGENMGEVYKKLSIKGKVDYDLFLAYTLNTLYWLYLRTRGEDPNQNEVKEQLVRVKEYMVKAKQAHERTTIRPKIDTAAAKRFVKHGLHISKDNNEDDKRPNKKIKFDD